MNELNPLLYGKNTEENIVAVEHVPRNDNRVQVFKRENGELTSYYDTLDLFCYLNDQNPILDQLWEGTTIEPLLGTGYYNRVVKTDNYGLVRWINKNTKESYAPMKSAQYFISTGKTLFKGMDFDSPLRMYFDIEVLTKKGFNFPNSTRPEDKVILIAVHFNHTYDDIILALNEDGDSPELFNTKNYDSESELLEDFITLMSNCDPDVLVNQNLFNFDLTYLQDRCKLHDIKFALGRNGTEPYTFDTEIKIDGGRSQAFTNFNIYGRHCIDTFFLIQQYDAIARDMDSHSLKYAVKYLKKESSDRVYIEGNDISPVWRGEHSQFTRTDLIKYALDDVYEAQIVDQSFGQTMFYQTQMVCYGYQDTARYGVSGKFETMLVRAYNDMNWSLPKSQSEEDRTIENKGGYSDAYRFGIVKENLVYVDVSSLYPWIRAALSVVPHWDELEIFETLITLVKDFRMKYKAIARKLEREGKDNTKEDSIQSTMKIMLNSGAYGYLDFVFSLFNNLNGASRMTEFGREIIKQMRIFSEELGSEVIKLDTDGMICILPDEYEANNYDSEMKFIKRIEEEMHQWIVDEGYSPENFELDNDGSYRGAIIFDKKSYVLIPHEGKMKVKGNTLKGRGLEPMFRDFLSEAFDLLLDNPKEISELYDNLLFRIENRLVIAEEIAKKTTLNKTKTEYLNEQAGDNNKNPIAQYELAFRQSNRPYIKGDSIKYYVSQPPMVEKEYKTKPNKMVPKKMANYEKANLIDEYNFDYDIKEYTKKLNNTTRRLLLALGKETFEKLFPDIKLYKKDRDKLEKRNNE